MNILITGATGFIGSHLTERLVKEGNEVRVLVRNSELDNHQNKESLELIKKIGVEIFKGNLLDKDSLKGIGKNIDVVFHLAAIARPMAIPKESYFKVNEEGTRNLLESLRNEKLKKIIIMSSVSVVGPTRDGNPVNETTMCRPVDTYGFSKLAEEKVAFDYIKNYNFPIVLLRPPMVFGPRDLEILRLFKMMNTGFFPVRGKEKGMELLYVENLVEACVLAIKNGKSGEIYHITNGPHYCMNEIIRAFEKANDKKIINIKFPRWTFYIGGYFVELVSKIAGIHPPFSHDTITWMTKKFWYSDASKAKEELGYNPKISLEEGMKRTLDYYKQGGYF